MRQARLLSFIIVSLRISLTPLHVSYIRLRETKAEGMIDRSARNVESSMHALYPTLQVFLHEGLYSHRLSVVLIDLQPSVTFTPFDTTMSIYSRNDRHVTPESG